MYPIKVHPLLPLTWVPTLEYQQEYAHTQGKNLTTSCSRVTSRSTKKTTLPKALFCGPAHCETGRPVVQVLGKKKPQDA